MGYDFLKYEYDETRYEDIWGEERHSDSNLRRMCDQGVQRMKRGKWDAIRFDCFNSHETDVVNEHMLLHYPDITFYTTRIF